MSGKKKRGPNFHPDEDNHLKKVIVEKCFSEGLPENLKIEDLSLIEREIPNWTEELKLPGFEERSAKSWQARFRKEKEVIFDIVRKPQDGRVARAQSKKIVVGSRVKVKLTVEAVVKGFDDEGKAILEFPNGEWHDVKEKMRDIKDEKTKFEKNQLELIEDSEKDDDGETVEEEEARTWVPPPGWNIKPCIKLPSVRLTNILKVFDPVFTNVEDYSVKLEGFEEQDKATSAEREIQIDMETERGMIREIEELVQDIDDFEEENYEGFQIVGEIVEDLIELCSMYTQPNIIKELFLI